MNQIKSIYISVNEIKLNNFLKMNPFKFIYTAKPVGSACLCNALYRDTCNALHRYKKA